MDYIQAVSRPTLPYVMVVREKTFPRDISLLGDVVNNFGATPCGISKS